MSKTKTTVVTALVAGMLAAILIGLYSLAPKAFYTITGLLALVGYGCAAVVFFRWLGGEKRESRREALLPPAMEGKSRTGERKANGEERNAARTSGRGKPLPYGEEAGQQADSIRPYGETAGGGGTPRAASPTSTDVSAAGDGAAVADEAWVGDYDAIRAEVRGEEA